MAEVDFVMSVNSRIVPIEVKAGSTRTLKSLQILMNEKNLNLGVHISAQPLQFNGRILSVPIYMVGEISRLIKNL